MDERDFVDMEKEAADRLFDDLAKCEHEDGNGYCNSLDPAGCKHALSATGGHWACERSL